MQAVGNASGPDQFTRGLENYDFLASCKLSLRWALKFAATNLTAAPEQRHHGASRRNLKNGDTGRSYALGLNWTY